MNLWQAFVSLYSGSAVVALIAAAGAWRRRTDAPAAVPLAVALLGLAVYSAAEAAQALIPDGRVREQVVSLVVPAGGLVIGGFVCEAHLLVDDAWRPSRRLLLALGAYPALMTLMTLIEPVHRQFVVFRAGASKPWLPWRPGPLSWLHIGYTYALIAWCFLILLRGLLSSTSPLQRRHLRAALLSGLFPAVGSLLTIVFSGPGGEIAPDFTPLFILVTAGVHYYAVLWQGLLRMLPIARDLVLDTVSDAVFVVDPRGRVTDINPAGVRLARRVVADLPSSLIGVPARRLLPPKQSRRALTDGEYHVVHPDGVVDLDVRISDLADRKGRPMGRVLVVRDVTELNDQRRHLIQQLQVIDRLRHELAELAARDELTGLHNRRHLLTELETGLERARSDGTPLAVVLLDIDHFKSVNDRFGHAGGDRLLAAAAATLAGCVHASDTVARYGGEEFVVLLPGAGGSQAIACAETMRRRIATTLVETESGPISVTMSAGVAYFPDCGWTGDVLLQKADEALYQAKGAGRDRVVGAWTV